MSRQGVIDTLTTHLEGYTRPSGSSAYFAKVYAHRPLGLAPIDKLCIFYLEGEAEIPFGRQTMRTAMVGEAWGIKCFWQQRPVEEARENLVLEQWDAMRGIQTLLRGDSQLGGNVDDLKMRGYPVIQEEAYGDNDVRWDVLTIQFDTWNLNAEAIAV